jgi:hypothetical protein
VNLHLAVSWIEWAELATALDASDCKIASGLRTRTRTMPE